MPRYKSSRQYYSRLQKQESKRLKRQTIFIILITVALLIALIFLGIPLLIRTAVLLSGNDDSPAQNQDTLPPQTPQLSAILEATSSASLSLNGVSEPGATVTLFQNNQEVAKTIVNASGTFEFLTIELEQGSNTFYAVAKDLAENLSQRSPTRSIQFDTTPPNLTITSPEPDEMIVGATKQTIDVEGSTDSNTKVMLNGRVIVVLSDGTFTTKHSLQEGQNILTFEAVDAAGNLTSKDVTISYSVN